MSEIYNLIIPIRENNFFLNLYSFLKGVKKNVRTDDTQKILLFLLYEIFQL